MQASSRTNGATPLVMACLNGHQNEVLHLLEKCQADVEQVGTVTFDGELVEGTPPLWCAAVAGHLSIVKILIRFNASVNSTTKTNSTPLRAACFNGHFSIAKYLIEHGANIDIETHSGQTCLMVACYGGHLEIVKYLLECGANTEIANHYGQTCLKIACYRGHCEIVKVLLECGADVNRIYVEGNTVLHDCAESGNLTIIKMLLQHGAKFQADSFGTTPLMFAAIAGQASVFEYFIGEFDFTKQEKVDALEVLGAAYVDKKDDMVMALICWREAMKLRYEDVNFPLEKPSTRPPIADLVDSTEVHTFAELENLISDPNEMRNQALISRERILGPSHPDAIYSIRCRGKECGNNGDFDRCIQLWMYTLDVKQKLFEPVSEETESIILSFAQLFSIMMSDATSFPVVPFRDILGVFRRAVNVIETAMELSAKEISSKEQSDQNVSSQFHRTLIILLHLAGLMCRLMAQLSDTEHLELKRTIYHLVHLDPRAENRWTLLHLACSKNSSPIVSDSVITFPSSDVVHLLLEVGANPNAVDVANNTPLHVAAMNEPCARAVFKLMLDHGAHLDLCNSERKTPLQLANDAPLLDIDPFQYINLQCLSAQMIRRFQIPYKELVHKDLELFLEAH